MIWIRLNKNKRFFVDGNFVKGYSCWFDKKPHGTESDGYSIHESGW